ncbi:hypothetical protein PRZ48_009720 [Zasmidium cellare]|uniref:Uncharacterized protein n=1 Tax=Zasmidium cellare TaxID=395010 RepID=A0ABR0ECM4_ZASCE|nr:hypothetical protein PRZ48_009720 [Zasmidium cellare]
MSISISVQVGAPYDVNHCLELESTLVNWCLVEKQGVVYGWHCYDDGSTMYGDGTVGAYDIYISIAPGESVCVEKVLDDQFEEVRANTGGFKCSQV